MTASVEAEAALVQRARQFRAVFLDAADAMLVLDDTRTILDANPAACALFGLEHERLVSDRSTACWSKRAGDQLVTAWRELLALGEAKREHRVVSGPDRARASSSAATAPACTATTICASRATSPTAGSSKSGWRSPRRWRASAGSPAASRTTSTTC